MKRNVKNDKVLRAITIGLATMIAATSMPTNVWADGEGDPQEPTIADAEKAAEDAEKAVDTPDSVEDAADSVSEAIDIVTDTNNDSQPVEAASKEDGGAVAQEAVGAFVDAIDKVEVKDPVTDEVISITKEDVQKDLEKLPDGFDVTKVEAPGEEKTDLSVSADLEIVEAELKKAGQAEQQADSSPEKIFDYVQDVDNKDTDAIRIVEGATKSVADATSASSPIIARIENASTADEVNAAFAELDKLTNDTQADINTRRAAFNVLKGKYAEAKTELTDAEAEYDRAIGHAGAHVGYADKKLGDVKAYVDALAKACGEAKDKIGDEGTAAETINKELKDVENIKTVNNGSYSQQREAAIEVIRGYVIPQLIKGATNITYAGRTGGFDTQNGNSYGFTYTKDEKLYTIYFNYDREDREVSASDQWNISDEQRKIDKNGGRGLGIAKNIIIFEKPEEEFRADEYLRKYYGTTANNLEKNNPALSDEEKKVYANSGYKDVVNSDALDVFKYVDSNGNTQYICRDELNKYISGDIKKTFTYTYNNKKGKWEWVNNKDKALPITYDQDGDGNIIKWYVDGKECIQVVQSTSQTVRDGMRTINVAEDEDLRKFLSEAGDLAKKYEEYNKSITKAQDKVDTAKKATEDLKDKIGALSAKGNSKKYDRRNSLQSLIDEYQIMEYLSEDDINDILALDQAGQIIDMPLDPVKVLDKVLEKLEKQLQQAELDLQALVQKRDEIKDQLDNGEDADNDDDGSDDDDTAGDAGFAGPSGYVASSGFGATPIILPSTTAIFGGTGTAGGEGSGVLGVRAGNPADQISSSLDSKIVNKPVAKKMIANKTIANKTNKKGTKIEDPIVPLAESPFEDSTRLNWGWLLIIFLLGATGKKLYEEYKKKQEEANAAKSK